MRDLECALHNLIPRTSSQQPWTLAVEMRGPEGPVDEQKNAVRGNDRTLCSQTLRLSNLTCMSTGFPNFVALAALAHVCVKVWGELGRFRL